MQALESSACSTTSLPSSVDILPSKDFTLIELTGNDRPGLLSEVCAVLKDLHCNVVKAEVWTHNTRAAAVIQVTDESTLRAIEDRNRLSRIKDLLYNVLKGDSHTSRAKMAVSDGLAHTERRLHRLMFDDRDYEQTGVAKGPQKSRPQVTVTNCVDRHYTVVMLRSKDRPKLLFDTLCSLSDMHYLVFHASIDATRSEAYQVGISSINIRFKLCNSDGSYCARLNLNVFSSTEIYRCTRNSTCGTAMATR